MVTKEELKKSPEKKLTDEELSKVAGGKDWEESDIEAGQVFLYWESETTWCFRKVIQVYNGMLSYVEYRITKTNINEFSKQNYDGYSVQGFVDALNKYGSCKKSLPSGFVG